MHPLIKFTHEELKEAFEQVECPRDWKAPIDALIPLEKYEITKVAIEFFTATVPSFEHMCNGMLRVRSIGYRNGPAGP